MKSSEKNRVLVIGLDGATFSLMDPWIEQGKLPTFARIRRMGVTGDLRSTIRPVSTSAWVSFMTGVNPGKHGIYGFFECDWTQYERRLISSRSVGADTLWSYLSRNGKQVGVINVPITYPPSPVRGVLVAGMLSPSVDQEFTYPREFRRELLRVVGDYIIEPEARVPQGVDDLTAKRRLAEILQQAIEARKRATLHLMNNYPWDFIMTVFYARIEPNISFGRIWTLRTPATTQGEGQS